MAEHTLVPDLDTVHWGYLDASLPPVLEIDDGDTVTVHSASGSADVLPTGGATVRPELLKIQQTLRPELGPHILTGPIFVRDARPGDFLKIEILAIDLRDDWGFNIIQPGKGVLSDDFHQQELVHFGIDRHSGQITTPWDLKLEARPFFGIMGTAPKREDGRLSSVVPGYFGGNIDNTQLVAGSNLYLPVSVEGALFSAGDGHAAQGDGEVCLTAVETGLIGRLRISVVRDADASVPYAETPSHLIAMAFDTDMDEAIRQALRHAIDLIRTRTGLTAAQAYTLCSIAADIRITQLVNVKKGIHVMIPKSILNETSKA